MKMGYMCHHAIIVISWDKGSIVAAHKKACEIFENQNFLGTISYITEITPEATNGYRSFLISPDGSKEGWETSDRGDIARNRFIQWLDSQKDNYCEYAEVQFGDENGDNRLLKQTTFGEEN